MWSNSTSDFDDHGYDEKVLKAAMILNSLKKDTDNSAISLPTELRNLIESENGADVLLVMEKKLSASDLSRKQNRLLFAKEIKNKFLTNEEINKLDQDGVTEATVIQLQPCLKTTPNVQLKKRTKYGGQYFDYVLTGNWFQIVENGMNCLQTNDTVRLWSFRKGLELYFALVKA